MFIKEIVTRWQDAAGVKKTSWGLIFHPTNSAAISLRHVLLEKCKNQKVRSTNFHFQYKIYLIILTVKDEIKFVSFLRMGKNHSLFILLVTISSKSKCLQIMYMY